METQNASGKPVRSAMAVASLVLGIIALLTSLLPIINNLSFLLAALGLIFAVVGLVGCMRGKRSGKGLAIAALIVNIAAVALVLGSQSVYSAALDDAASPATVDVQSDEQVAQGGDDSADSAKQEADYSISDEELDASNEYAAVITGALTNNTDEEKRYIQVEYVIYDAEGAQIGTALANTNNLKAGGTWKYEAYSTVSPSEVDSWELADVTGF